LDISAGSIVLNLELSARAQRRGVKDGVAVRVDPVEGLIPFRDVTVTRPVGAFTALAGKGEVVPFETVVVVLRLDVLDPGSVAVWCIHIAVAAKPLLIPVQLLTDADLLLPQEGRPRLFALIVLEPLNQLWRRFLFLLEWAVH
jgi:hypothetical protein